MCQWLNTSKRAHYSLAKQVRMLHLSLLPNLSTVLYLRFLSLQAYPYLPLRPFLYLSSCLMVRPPWPFSSRVVSSPQQTRVQVALALWHAHPRKRFCQSTPTWWVPPRGPRLTVSCGSASLPASCGSTSCAIIGDCPQGVLPSFYLTCYIHSRAQSYVWRQLSVVGMLGTMQRGRVQYSPRQ